MLHSRWTVRGYRQSLRTPRLIRCFWDTSQSSFRYTARRSSIAWAPSVRQRLAVSSTRCCAVRWAPSPAAAPRGRARSDRCCCCRGCLARQIDHLMRLCLGLENCLSLCHYHASMPKVLRHRFSGAVPSLGAPLLHTLFHHKSYIYSYLRGRAPRVAPISMGAGEQFSAYANAGVQVLPGNDGVAATVISSGREA